MTLAVGDVVPLHLERPAHGGSCVGRYEGQVVFARHGIPGEEVRVEVTAIGSGGRYVRADVIEVLAPSADRITPRCPHARPGGCGGCDWQHVALPRQRDMKVQVIREQLVRVGGMDPANALLTDLVVEPCGDDADGFAYRTRMDFVADARGRLGLRSARSHDVIALPACPLAVTAINEAEAWRRPWAAGAVVRFTEAGDGVHVTPEGVEAATVPQVVDGIAFEVAADGFWQVHRHAAAHFVQAARGLLAPKAGEFLLDLYGGVGLFARMLADDLGAGGRVVCVESDRRAGRLAKRNLRAVSSSAVVVERVDRWLAERSLQRVDIVVLDPPRAGAGERVIVELARLAPRAILYVACDPASLARDIAYARDAGYHPTAIRAIDAFPQTAHVETLVLLQPTSVSGGAA